MSSKTFLSGEIRIYLLDKKMPEAIISRQRVISLLTGLSTPHYI